MLSIIVPVYNVEPYIEECVYSLLKQNYQDIEILLIDDGSTDSSGKICDFFQSIDSRVRVYHTENCGVGHARNLGLKYAKGDFITFVDSDDYVSPDIYQTNIAIMEKDNAIDFLQIPIFGRKAMQEKLVEGTSVIFDLWILENKKITNYFWDKIFRKSLFDGLNFPEDMRYEDRYLFSDILVKIKKVFISMRGLYYYRQHSGQLTKQNSVKLIENMIVANLHTLSNLPKKCYSAYVLCYWETWNLILNNSLDCIRQECFVCFPKLRMILLSKVALGIKLRLFFKCLSR